jgi:hypothetical protein
MTDLLALGVQMIVDALIGSVLKRRVVGFLI